MDLTESECEDMAYIYLVRDRGPVAGSCKRGNELSRSIQRTEFLEKLLKKTLEYVNLKLRR
jgi:hypothetical protein